jgi:hypothetical protein
VIKAGGLDCRELIGARLENGAGNALGGSRHGGRPEVLLEVRFAMDSPLEGDGFELKVPRRTGNAVRHPR